MTPFQLFPELADTILLFLALALVTVILVIRYFSLILFNSDAILFIDTFQQWCDTFHWYFSTVMRYFSLILFNSDTILFIDTFQQWYDTFIDTFQQWYDTFHCTCNSDEHIFWNLRHVSFTPIYNYNIYINKDQCFLSSETCCNFYVKATHIMQVTSKEKHETCWYRIRARTAERIHTDS